MSSGNSLEDFRVAKESGHMHEVENDIDIVRLNSRSILRRLNLKSASALLQIREQAFMVWREVLHQDHCEPAFRWKG